MKNEALEKSYKEYERNIKCSSLKMAEEERERSISKLKAELSLKMAGKNPTQDVGKMDSALDIQHGGDHYQKLGNYQPWEVLAKWMTPEELKGAMKKEVITYLCREADKGGLLDIKKAAHTLQIYLELVEK